jgi:hypothetical protein
MKQTFDIFIDELVTDEEFRETFLRRPRQTLALADDWGLPLSSSEIRSLIATEAGVWDRLAETLNARLIAS